MKRYAPAKRSLPTHIALCTISCLPLRIRHATAACFTTSTLLAQFDEVVRVLEQRRVRYVLWDTHFQAKEVPALFPASARISSGALIIEPYLESHYKVVWADADTRLMERRR